MLEAQARREESAPSLVPARMVNEVLYCERLSYLEWSQGEFEDNEYTVEGRAAHRRADDPGGALPPLDEGDDQGGESAEAPAYQARSVWLSSERLGLTAKIDIVEGEAGGVVIPIEYKRGSPPEVPEGAYLPERAQVCAQVLLLREHGYVCERGEIYFAAARQRVPVVIDEGLIAQTLGAVERARALASTGVLPPPLVNSPKCNGCSLVGICLPDETTLLARIGGVGVPEGRELRRLHPARDDRVPVLVQEQGARVTLSGEELVVVARNGDRVPARLANTSQLSVYGNVQMTTQALRALIERGVPVSLFTYGGWYLGRVSGHESKNVELRVAQYRAAASSDRCLGIARGLVESKVKNARTMLRRNHREPSPVVLKRLGALGGKARRAGGLEGLLGIEGSAAREYFGHFGGMLRAGAGVDGFDFEGRNRRPPRDPVNAMLSFVYGLLTKDFAVALGAAGLDPLLGFYHQPRFGRPALALDLMEEFRPLLADSVVVTAINTGVVGPEDFVRAAGGCAMKAPGRKRLILAYERRMDQLVTHPVFGYRLSYRRVLEVQARLCGRWVLGEIEAYPPFNTR